jgi:hypothetical protein
MSHHLIAAVYNDSLEARRVFASAFVDFDAGERGEWRELQPAGARGSWRVAYCTKWRFFWAYRQTREWLADELRTRLRACLRGDADFRLVLLAYEDQSATSGLWAVTDEREIVLTLDDRGQGVRVFRDERGKRRRQTGTIEGDDDPAIQDAAEAPFSALRWLEEHTGIGSAALLAGIYDAPDKGDDILRDAALPAPSMLPADVRRQLRSTSSEARAEAVRYLYHQKTSNELHEALADALEDADAGITAAAAEACALLAERIRAATDEAGRRIERGLRALLIVDEYQIATDAALALGYLCGERADVIAAAYDAFSSATPLRRAIGAYLSILRSDAVADQLAHGLTDETGVRTASLIVFAKATTLPARVAPAIIAALEAAPETDARLDLLCALATVRGAAELVLPAVEASLARKDTRPTAIYSLGKADVPLDRKRAILMPLLTADVVYYAAKALARAGVPVSELLAAIPANGGSERVRLARVEACGELAKLEPEALGPLAALERYVDDRSAKVATIALMALVNMAAARPEARESVRRATEHKVSAVSELAQRHLKDIPDQR